MLALQGGKPVRVSQPRKYPWFSGFDASPLLSIIEESSLSGFLASKSDEHFGGKSVKELEAKWSERYQVQHSISFHSWTSGLEASVAACSLKPGGEVITPAWTMSATVASIMHNRLNPFFVDINPNNFNLDVDIIQEAITPKTVAIMGVDIFGKPCDAPKIREICDEKDLMFIVDSAQTPLAKIEGKRSIKYANVGGFSLNRHKHLQVGEGGIAVTDDDDIAKKMRLLRNHAEVTSQEFDINVPIGHNFRMGEMEAILAAFQLRNLERLVEERRNYGRYLVENLSRFDWIQLNSSENFIEHDFYILGFSISDEFLSRTGGRERIVQALRAEGLTELVAQYGNLHKLSAFRDCAKTKMRWTEKLSETSFLGIYLCGYAYTLQDLNQIVEIFGKIDKYLYL